MQTIAPVSPRHQAAGEFVDDHHLFPLDDVVHVALVEVVRLQGVVDQMGPLHIARRVKTLNPGQFLGLADAVVGQVGGMLLLVDFKVRVAPELPGDPIGHPVAIHVVARGTGDDQRRARLVDEDVVHLVDDRIVQGTLHLLQVQRVPRVAPGGRAHIVAEVVKAVLVVRSVRDVAGVGLLPLVVGHVALDRADREPQRHVQGPHPLHVAPRQVVVDRDDVDPFALQGVEIGRQRGDERLPFAGHHLRDRPAVEHHAADQLDVVMPQPQHAAAGLAANRKDVDEQIVEGLARRQSLAKLVRLAAKLRVGQFLKIGLSRVDRVDGRLELANVAGVRRAENPRHGALHPSGERIHPVRKLVKNAFEQFHGCWRRIPMKTKPDRR